MEGLPLDVILLVSIGIVAVTSLVVYISRKLTSNDEDEEGAATGIDGSNNDTTPGRLARHPGGECPICLSIEVETPVQTNCGHWFCARCILSYYDQGGRVRIRCPMCRQEVTMLHGAAGDAQAAGDTDQAHDARAESAPAATTGSPEIQEEISRFNDRNSGRWRSPWQVIEDAPLLLRRLWSDLSRGDTRVFGELMRRGVQLQLFVAALYILSPIDVIPESLVGIAGLLDDLVVVVFLLLHLTSVYRTVLLSWERSRAARAEAAAAAAASTATASIAGAAAAAAAATAPPAAVASGEGRFDNSPQGAGIAAVLALLVGALLALAGGGEGQTALGAGAMGAAVAAAAERYGSRAPRVMPPLAGDW
ncbi:unnamed protein product [Ectocarpus sp. CCAP 1310/34]|nr:unnamed protein product [Ectocarpus sp. CCAP 1310/34]